MTYASEWLQSGGAMRKNIPGGRYQSAWSESGLHALAD
ncbi:hypothetical protein APY03_2321 [Variovorax sp. WDL1]|nr:hypothetical protein APY03_2321 [Variovorax sp. WDL1]